MEPSEEPSQINKDNFLEVPNLSDFLPEDEEVRATFRPGFSPQPSRRGSDSSEDVYLDTPSAGTRRVSFADTFGFNLVSVKEFDCWDLPSVLTNFDLRKDIFHPEEYVLSPLFDLPSSEELMQQLQVHKAILESAEYLPGCTSMKGIIRVLNISFEKLVYVRMSLDDWQTHYDMLAEYVPNSCDGETDQFSFKISLVPPYQKDGSKVEFCIRYETSVGIFWSNNNGANYILVCQKKEQELKPVKSWEGVSNRQIKGCLKVKSSKEESSVTSYENNFENSKVTDTYIPIIVCSHEEKEDLETGNQNVKDVNREHDEHNEKELKLMVNECLIRSSASKDENNTFSKSTVNFPNKAEGLEKKYIYDEVHTDLLKRTLSSCSSPETSLKRDFYHDEIFFSGNECSHQPSEEITSDMRKIKPSLRNIGSDKLVKSHISIKEALDDNANPDKRRGRVQISCPSSDQLMANNLNKKHEGEAIKIKIKDWECLRRDLYSDFHLGESIEKGSSKKDYGNGTNEKEKHLSVNEKQSKCLQSILHDQEKTNHSEINVDKIGASCRELTVLMSKDTTASDQTIRTDLSQSPTGNLGQEEAVLTTPECDISTSKGTTLGMMPDQVCSGNRGILRNDHLFQAEEENSYGISPEDQNKNKQHKQPWNVLEGQEKARESKANTTEHIKEQADCEDMWDKRDNTKNLNATPTEKLFTCQETVSCALSSLTDHDITEKAEAGTAYIIKTTSESALESMSVREKAINAKLSQGTAQNDKPIELKETVFDIHEGRKDDSHYTFCQGDNISIIYDNDFEKKTHLDIYNVHVDEMESDETLPMYNPPKKCSIGNITSVEESLQVFRGNQKPDSKLNLYLRMLPTDKKTFPKSRDHGQVQELSKGIDVGAIINSALNSDPNRLSENGSHISNHCAKTPVSSYEQAVAIESTVTTMTLQSIPSKSEYNFNPSSAVQGIEKYPHPWDIPEEVSKSSGIMTSVRREKCIGPIFQQGKCNVKKYLGPMALLTEDIENVEEAKHKNEGLLNSEQSLCSPSDKESESSASANLHDPECQAQSSGSLLLKYINSNTSYFLLFLIFLVTIYQYDLMISLAFYLFLLYCLSWDGGRQKKSVRKK
ncbi:protein phosphatase 1 regulatory subunit 3A [Pteronotus mesoamericanus]|uniref:protein phosphatase 1 regulatory subunit 3A n=1 Tax=Pteronotus mesoamericanus TaxID=1884717 RepID=UPI0023ED24B1|nr:protein phosphatase 1 regulatory subunit 3A [Pteronotus parnellii mesoamericanus]